MNAYHPFLWIRSIFRCGWDFKQLSFLAGEFSFRWDFIRSEGSDRGSREGVERRGRSGRRRWRRRAGRRKARGGEIEEEEIEGKNEGEDEEKEDREGEDEMIDVDADEGEENKPQRRFYCSELQKTLKIKILIQCIKDLLQNDLRTNQLSLSKKLICSRLADHGSRTWIQTSQTVIINWPDQISTDRSRAQDSHHSMQSDYQNYQSNLQNYAPLSLIQGKARCRLATRGRCLPYVAKQWGGYIL